MIPTIRRAKVTRVGEKPTKAKDVTTGPKPPRKVFRYSEIALTRRHIKSRLLKLKRSGDESKRIKDLEYQLYVLQECEE